MLLAARILLITAGVLLLLNAWLMFTHRPNPIKGLPLPCPVSLSVLGLGIILFSIASF